MLTCDAYNHEQIFDYMDPHMKQLLLLAFLPLILISNAQAADTLKVIDPWIPESPPGVQVMAAYMKLQNDSPQEIRITGVTSTAFERVEMHLSKEVDGVARMLPQASLTVPGGQQLVLSAGGYHLMLIKPLKRLRDGDSAMMTLQLSNGEQLSFGATVKKNTMPATGGMKCGAGKCGGK